MSARPEDTTPLGRLRPAFAAQDTSTLEGTGRSAAFEALLAAGLPTPRDDAWKYTSLRLLERRDLAPAAVRPIASTALDELPALGGPRLVFVDGRFHAALSNLRLAQGCTFATHETVDVPDVEDAPLAAEARIRTLNACFAQATARLTVAAGTVVTEPVELVCVATGGGAYPRVRIELGEHSSLQLVEQHHSVGADDAFQASVIDATLDRGAALLHNVLQVAGNRTVLLADSVVTIAADAHYRYRLIAIGGQLARQDLRIHLTGAGARAELAGLFMADGSREQHVRTVIEHRAPHGSSDQLFRGVAAGRGRGSYDGKVIVHKGAMKTDSRQSSRNLLLSREAEIDTRPQLEINADDVKCGHGATTGTLDKEMEFYLLSRGLDREAARALLTYAFVGDVLKRLAPEPLRRAAEARVLGRLPDAALLREFVL